MVVCFYRESFEVKLGKLAGLMRILEVFGLCMYFTVFVLSLNYYSFWMYDFSIDSLKKYMNIDFETQQVLLVK